MRWSLGRWWSEPHISEGSFLSQKNHKNKLWAGNKLVTWRTEKKQAILPEQKDPVEKGKDKRTERYHHVGSVHRLCISLWARWEAIRSFKWKSGIMYLGIKDHVNYYVETRAGGGSRVLERIQIRKILQESMCDIIVACTKGMEKEWNSGYTLKVEPTGFAPRLNVEAGWKKKPSMTLRFLAWAKRRMDKTEGDTSLESSLECVMLELSLHYQHEDVREKVTHEPGKKGRNPGWRYKYVLPTSGWY